ncbi:MAG: CRISPR-associated endonuclease Cas2 [bacterium]|nr:CRISPR-associated endonuclease Cas2 [bacterium]
MAGRRRYLVAYDIREGKRLRRVHKTMKGYGWSLQYSVFICDLDSMELLAMRTDLGDIIHHALDSIAIVDIGAPEDRGSECFRFMGLASRLPTSGPVVI